MLLALYAFGSESTPADSSQPKQLKKVAITDGFALGGISGLVTRSSEGSEFFFHPDEPITDKTATIEKGSPIKMLESSSLGAIKSVYKEDKPLRLKAWGMLTVYDKTNYAYINYALPITDEIAEPLADQPQESNETEGDQVIPQDVLGKLRGGRRIDTAASSGFDSQKTDSIYADRTGFIELDKAGKYVFIPDGLGQNVQNEKFYLLKCQTLENASGSFSNSVSRVRYKVAGITNEFDGKKYLLLQRAARVYGYGNLSEF